MQAFNAWQSPNILAHKWGGGGGPPWGEFNGIGSKCLRRRYGSLLLNVLKLVSLKNGALEGSGLDFGGPGARFWRSEAQFFHDFRMFLAVCAETLPRSCAAYGSELGR